MALYWFFLSHFEHLCEYFLNVKILCDFSEKFLLEGIT